MAKYDRSIPFNDLPPLPPPGAVEADPEILKKLISAARTLVAVDAKVHRLPNPYVQFLSKKWTKIDLCPVQF